MSNKINVDGIDPARLLKALYDGTRPQGMGVLHAVPGGCSIELAREQLAHDSYVDYFLGRPIKVDFGNDEVRPFCYDRDAGEGRFAAIVEALRSGGN
jgi:hypothetical protein